MLELDRHLAGHLNEHPYDAAFPIAHGAVGEDGSLQGLLELLGLPYVGSNVLASALAMHKPSAKVFFERAGLPIAKGTRVEPGNAATSAKALLEELGNALVVKPAASGSAVGVAKLESATASNVERALLEAWNAGGDALVEQMLKGREVTCGVLDLVGEERRALPPTEVLVDGDPFYDFRARYGKGRSQHVCPAELGNQFERVQDAAIRAHAALGCRDLSRVDFVVAENGFIVLEVNTLPGFTATSLFPEAAGIAGIPIAALCARLVESAIARGATRRFATQALPT